MSRADGLLRLRNGSKMRVEHLEQPRRQRRSMTMAIGVYFPSQGLTSQRYGEILKQLEAAGASAPKGRSYHASFGDPGDLQVFDVWDSQADFDAFGAILMPIMQKQGITPARSCGGLPLAARRRSKRWRQSSAFWLWTPQTLHGSLWQSAVCCCFRVRIHSARRYDSVTPMLMCDHGNGSHSPGER